MEKNSNIKLLANQTPAPKYFNRELSWLEFNHRVLREAMDPSTPLLERVKFIAIYSRNLDEFFMVRVAGLKRMLSEGFTQCLSPDQMLIQEVLKRIRAKILSMNAELYTYLKESMLPELAQQGVVFSKYDELNQAQKDKLDYDFYLKIFPALTPLAVDPSHPFPFLTNSALYIVVTFAPHASSYKSDLDYGFIEIPARLPRMMRVENSEHPYHFVLLEELIIANINSLFPTEIISSKNSVRVSRNTDYTILESDVDDLRKFLQKEVLNRENQQVVRLTVDAQISDVLLQELSKNLNVEADDVYRIPGPLNLSDMDRMHELPLPQLKEEPFNPRLPKTLAGTAHIFKLLRKEDILVHHPYESFYTVTDFLNRAAHDEKVLAIKQTLYRTSGDSPIIDALINAAHNGKKVTVVVELKARFDEKNNIIWARRLEHAGVNVVFGFVGLKTHAKATLVVRNENNRLKCYTHLSTGNYNSQTATRYTDLGLLTARDDIGEDISLFFNVLTGFNIHSIRDRSINLSSFPKFKKVIIGPMFLRSFFQKMIRQEIQAHQQHKNGFIFAKMNSLVDQEIIDLLYEASQAGVKIRLMVRGICSLVPGVPGISENIEVRAILDRFLEHSRIYHFHANGDKHIYLGSADLMTRNLDHRIEIIYPVESAPLKDRLLNEIIAITWADNVKAKELLPDGSYRPIKVAAGTPSVRSQAKFIAVARTDGLKSIPYEEAMHFDQVQKGGKRPLAKRSR